MSFIIPLFYRLLYMSIIASVIGITLILLKKFTSKEFSAKYNYLMWIIFIVALIFPAVIQSRLSLYNVVDLSSVQNLYIYPEEYMYIQVPSNNGEILDTIKESQEIKSEEAVSTENEIKVIEEKEPEINFINSAKNIIPYIWLGVLILLFYFYIVSYFVLKFKIGKEELKDERVKSILDKAREELKVKKDFKLIRQNYIKSPALIGVFNPKILVVDGIQEFSDKNLEYIFRHELSHYKRKDNISNTFLAIIKIVYWFNPAIWFIIKSIRKDMELAADEMAVKTLDTNERKEYCRLLVYLSSIYNSGFAERALGIADDKTNLEKRIGTVKITDKISKHPVFSAFLVFIIIGLVCLILYTNNYYERELIKPPKLYIVSEDGTKKEFITTSYTWNYKGNVSNYNIGFDENTYDYSEENTIILPSHSRYSIKTNPKYKNKVANCIFEKFADGKFEFSSNNNIGNNIDGEFESEFWQKNGIYTLNIYMKDYRNNEVEYSVRIIAINGNNVEKIQSLLNTKISNQEKVKQIIDYINMAEYLENYEIIDNTLYLTYKYYPGKESLNGMATILFTCIDDLENISFEFSHKKFMTYKTVVNEENVETVQVDFDLSEPILKNRNEVLTETKEESKVLRGEY